MNNQVIAFRTLLEAQESDTYTEELELSCLQVFPGGFAEVLLDVIERFGEDYVNMSDTELDAILDKIHSSITP